MLRNGKMKMIVLLVLMAGLVFFGCGGNGVEEATNGAEEVTEETDTPAEDTRYLAMATGGMAGTYYPLGGALSNVINNNVPGVRVSVEATGASVENLNLIGQGQSELALIASNIGYSAYHGEGAFEGSPIENVRGISRFFPELVQIVTLEGSGINSVEDLAGKRVAVGDHGSGVEVMANFILDVHGMSYDDLSQDFLGFSEAATGIQDRNIDAAFIWAGIPTAGVVDMATTNDIKIIQIEQDKLAEIEAQLDYAASEVIPAGTYTGVDEDIMTIAIPALLVTDANLEDDIVYEITKAMFENLESLTAMHERGRDVNIEQAMEGMSIPLHPGAERYLEEQGVL